MKYLFFLGQNAPLSFAELQALIPSFNHRLPGSKAILSTPQELDLEDLTCRLGGTVKVASFVSSFDSADLVSQLAEFIIKQDNKNFSLSFVDDSQQQALELTKQTKDELTKKNFPSRYLEPRQPFLSPLIIQDQQVTELIIDQQNQNLYHTLHWHSYQHWIERDRQKPYLTPKQGMLPPKLARIMVNLALDASKPPQNYLLDPFCGTGTILMEASLLGANTIGSDLSSQAIEGTRKNLDWLPQDHFCQQPDKRAKLYQQDATHLSQKIDQPVDFIVTEPSLGPPSPSTEDMSQIADGLEKLYLGALKDWQSFLSDQARLVMVFPRFKAHNRTITTHDFIDSHPALSYNIIDSSLIFTRPGAQIERQILILKFNQKNG